MRLHGQPVLDDARETFALPRGEGRSVVLTLRPLPLGFHRRLRRHGVVPPVVPTRVARDSNGRPVRDEQGKALLVADEQEGAYLDRVDQYHQRLAVLVAVEALRDDPGLTFDTTLSEAIDDWTDGADALLEEFESAGWSMGDLLRICDAACRLSNLIDEPIRRAYDDFFPEERPTEEAAT